MQIAGTSAQFSASQHTEAAPKHWSMQNVIETVWVHRCVSWRAPLACLGTTQARQARGCGGLMGQSPSSRPSTSRLRYPPSR